MQTLAAKLADEAHETKKKLELEFVDKERDIERRFEDEIRLLKQ